MHRILLVEDNETFRHALERLLQERLASVEILSAGNSSEAMAALEQHPVIVFMDLSLPGENGIELTRRVKQLEPLAQVIVLTAYCFPEYREAAFRNGADDFLCKDSISSGEIVALAEGILR